MSIQYQNDSFSENMPIPEALEKFHEAIESGQAKALHIGSELELQKVKRNVDMQSQIDDLTAALGDMKAEQSKIIAMPTDKQVSEFAKQ